MGFLPLHGVVQVEVERVWKKLVMVLWWRINRRRWWRWFWCWQIRGFGYDGYFFTVRVRNVEANMIEAVISIKL